MADRKTILLVEDEAIIALEEAASLERFGYGVVSAHTGEKAVELVDTRNDIDLILMDINLGRGIGGTEAAQRILRKHDLPLIFLSSHTEREVVEKTEGITSYGYIVKNSGDMVLSASLKMAFRLFDAKMKAKEKEAELGEQEALYRALVSGLPDIVIRYDRECRHLFVTENVSQMGHLTPTGMLGKTLREVGFPENDCRAWEDAILGVFDGGLPYENEISCEGPYGSAIFSRRLVPEFDGEGRVRSVLSISRNITEQRRLAAEYETLFREMLDGFVLNEMIFDGDGKPVDYRFTAVNPSFERLTGLKGADIIGKTVLEVLPGLEPRWIETYGRVVLTGEPVSFEDYLNDLGRHFLVTAYRPAPGQFACIFRNITERRRTESVMREAEERYRRIMENTDAGYFLVDGTGKYLQVNSAWLRMHGYMKPDEVIGRSFSVTRADPEGGETDAVVNQLMSGRKVSGYELSRRCRDGTIGYHSFSANPVVRNGTVVGYEGFLIDTTSHRKAEKERERILSELNGQRKELEILLECTTGVLETDDFQAAAIRIFNSLHALTGAVSGYVSLRSGETSEKPLFFERGGFIDIGARGFTLPVQELVDEVYTTGHGAYRNDFRPGATASSLPGIRADLKNIMSIPLVIAGETLGTLILANKPAEFGESDLRTAEAFGKLAALALQKNRSMNALRESEERYRFLADHSTDAVFSVDTDMRFTGMNRSFGAAIGLETHEILGKTPYDLGFSEEKISEWLPGFRETLGTGNVVRQEITASGSDRSGRTYEVILVPIMGSDGNTAGIRGSMRDITEQKKAWEEIRRLLDEKTLLLKEVHHRIRNNILSIEKLLSLQFGSVSNPEALSALQDAASRIAGMRILYEKMLLSGDYRDISIRRYLDDLIDSIFALFPERNGITLEKRLDDFSLETRLLFPIGIIVNELLTNIMKYAFSGTEGGTILVSVARNGNRVRLVVRDDGRGLPDGFDAETSRGFGLTLVKMLSRQLGGSLSMENSCGTTAAVEFDIA